MNRGRLISTILVIVAIALVIPAAIGLVRSGQGLTEECVEVEGIPVTVIAPDQVLSDTPAVMLVHGFAASSVIMEPLGRVLARAGYLVALPDLTGHGANTARLVGDDTARDELQSDVQVVLGWLSQRPGVDSDRLALVGHSMGAGAVTRFAIENPQAIRATVAISLPAEIDPVNIPRDLLLMYGASEPIGFAEAARQQLDAIRPGSSEGVLYGNLGEGTAIAVEVIPTVEHITIVWSTTTAESMLAWIGAAVEGPTSPVDLDPDWLWLLLILAAGCMVAIPLVRGLYGVDGQAPEARVAGWVAMVVTLGAAITASVLAAVLGAVGGSVADRLIPVSVGGYLSIWFAVAAVVIGLGMLLVRRYRRRSFAPFVGRPVVAGLVVTGYAVVLLIVSARLTWSSAALVGPRWWIWIVLSLILLGYFYADAVLVARPSLGARVGVMVVNRLIVVAALLLSVTFLGAPVVLTLLVPFMVLLFLIVGYLALVVSTRTPGRFGPALVQAVPLAAVLATSFPLVS